MTPIPPPQRLSSPPPLSPPNTSPPPFPFPPRPFSHSPRGRPRLTFSALAWLKWQFLCHAGPTEVAGFGLSSPHDPLHLDDVLVVRQRATVGTVAFDDHAVADLFDAMADGDVPPSRFARVWLHTHPGSSVVPSGTDEVTFARCFGQCDWAVMAILGRTGRTSARLRFSAGPGSTVQILTAVDWAGWPAAATDSVLTLAIEDWRREYETLVEPVGRSLPVSCFDAGLSAFAPFDSLDYFPGGFRAFD